MEQPDQENNLGWHFTLGYKLRDGRPVPPIGETLIHEGEIQICRSGLHCSKRLIDALGYAPGATLHQVRFGGDLQHQGDKLVSKERTILRTLPQEYMLPVLVEFSAWCAERATAEEVGAAEAAEVAWAARMAEAEAAEAAEAAGWATVEAVEAATTAATTVARAAARAATWAAETAERAARTMDATRVAEWLRAGWAAERVERETQNQELTRLVEEAFAKMEARG